MSCVTLGIVLAGFTSIFLFAFAVIWWDGKRW